MRFLNPNSSGRGLLAFLSPKAAAGKRLSGLPQGGWVRAPQPQRSRPPHRNTVAFPPAPLGITLGATYETNYPPEVWRLGNNHP